MCAEKYKLKAELEDINGKGIARAIIYLEKIVQVEKIQENSLHGKIKSINKLRNDIIHNAGITTAKRAQIYKEELDVELSDNGIIEITYNNAKYIHSVCDDFIQFVLSRDLVHNANIK